MNDMEITPNWLQDRAQNLETSFAIKATGYGHRIQVTE